jgi:hypothetical protein
MTSKVINLLSGYFSEEMAGAQPVLRTSLHNAGPDAVSRTRDEFRAFLRDRPMTHDEFYRATSAYFADDEQMYRAIGAAHRVFFDEEPPAYVG